MTPIQCEKIKKKISEIKLKLASEKRKLGCYDDSRGLRYLPAKYFIQLGDYAGGFRYLRWFDKNFPDDFGFPEFLFEWTIILFRCNKTKVAEQKAFHTFCANPYLFDKFFGRPVSRLNMWHSSSQIEPEYADLLEYSNSLPDLADFCAWLEAFISTDDFIDRSKRYIDIYRRLNTETDKEMRQILVRQAFELQQGI